MVTYLSKKRYFRKSLKSRVKSKSTYRRSYPTRLKGSRKRYIKNKSISRMLNNYGENKFQGSILECLTPVKTENVPSIPNQIINYNWVNLGKQLAPAIGAEWTQPMNLFNFPVLGNTADNPPPETARDGRYMFINKTHLKMEIQAMPVEDTAGIVNNLNNAIEFRLLIVRARRSMQPYGTTDDNTAVPKNSLYLTPNNRSVGYGSPLSEFSIYQRMNQPVNKRQWSVIKDEKFTLAPPSIAWKDVGDTASTNVASRYPSKRQLSCDLNVYKKTFFNGDEETAALQSTPTNYDTQTLVILQGVRQSYCSSNTLAPSVRDYSFTIQGTTSAKDS